MSPLLPITVMPGTSHMHESHHEKRNKDKIETPADMELALSEDENDIAHKSITLEEKEYNRSILASR